MFARLEGMAVRGSELVTAAMGHLVAARRGLSQDEILEVLWADADDRLYPAAISRETNHELSEGATRTPKRLISDGGVAVWGDSPGVESLGLMTRETNKAPRKGSMRAETVTAG